MGLVYHQTIGSIVLVHRTIIVLVKHLQQYRAQHITLLLTWQDTKVLQIQQMLTFTFINILIFRVLFYAKDEYFPGRCTELVRNYHETENKRYWRVYLEIEVFSSNLDCS